MLPRLLCCQFTPSHSSSSSSSWLCFTVRYGSPKWRRWRICILAAATTYLRAASCLEGARCANTIQGRHHHCPRCSFSSFHFYDSFYVFTLLRCAAERAARLFEQITSSCDICDSFLTIHKSHLYRDPLPILLCVSLPWGARKWKEFAEKISLR